MAVSHGFFCYNIFMSGKNIHFIGIGGVGMAALAVLLKARGENVSGCDLAQSSRTKWLESKGIQVFIGHDESHLDGVDVVVATPALRYDEPEFAEARARSIPVQMRGEVLSKIVSERESVAVCGSHGKTTTSTWIVKLLQALGEDVAWAIGGETGSFPVAGTGDGVLVVEADESDGTLRNYHPSILVVNRLDYDHPDHFKTEEDYFECFETVKRNSALVIESEALDLAGWDFPVAGLHNQRNARAAVEVAIVRGHSPQKIKKVISPELFHLPDRRFELIADGVYTDYAHHPSEMRNAISMARAVCRSKLRVLFQPHRYSRTKALLNEFPASLEGADEIVICPTYAAFESPVAGGDEADLYAACRARGLCVFLSQTVEEAWGHAANVMREGDVTLLLGAGDIVKLVPQVRIDRANARSMRPMRKIWIGQGTNTWRSELKLNVVYEKTSGPAGRLGSQLKIPWMAGVPGTIGGWVKMNAGAFGHSISEIVDKVKVDGRWIDSSECGFGYRHSGIDGEIQDVLFRNASYDGDEDGFLSRRPRFPAGTFGSFFKNPPGMFAGELLEKAGAKQLKVGGAYVWKNHANVIVRGKGATPSDVLALSRLMRNLVFSRFGVKLECEVAGILDN